MKKSTIIDEIKRISQLNNGKPPGVAKFITETGIKKSKWYPNLWLRWGDALIEAGFAPNSKNVAYDKDYLVQKYIELIDHFGHLPLEGEIRVKKKTDSTLPSHSAFRKLGLKYERAQAVIDYSNKRFVKDNIIELCKDIIGKNLPQPDIEFDDYTIIGYVYLIKHGSRNEYKIGKTLNPLRREGELKIQLPEKITPIHYIVTDDPSGIEAYWHKRFKDKRKEGEWFGLSKKDVNAFKKWKKII